jgi:hypothetical protein
VRLVSEHDHIGPIAKHGHWPAFIRRLELVDEREDIAMIAAQQLPKMRAARGVALVALGFAHCAGGFERFGNLGIQLPAVGHDHEGPVARHLAQHLLREEHHRETFAAALRLPEHAAAAMSEFAGFEQRGDGIVHAEDLVILPDDLHQPGLVL